MPTSNRQPAPVPRKVRYVLSDAAVKRLRAADRTMAELRERFYHQVPAAITNDISESYLALHEAVAEIARCDVETAPDDEPKPGPPPLHVDDDPWGFP